MVQGGAVKLDSLVYHFRRLRRELGQQLNLGGRGYRVRGYLPNRLTTDSHHERHLVAPLQRAVTARPGLFVDVGVNTGQTLLKLLSIAPTAPYLGFEPQVGCAFFIDQFIRDNRISNARVVPIALSDNNCMLPIFSQGQFDEMASLVERSNGRSDHAAASPFVAARIGDEVLNEMGVEQVAILKVDVEGAEISVFRGLKKMIASSRPICFFEVLPNFVGTERTLIDAGEAARNRTNAEALQSFFVDAGYRLTQIDRQGEERPITAFDLDTPARFVGSDYVAHPL